MAHKLALLVFVVAVALAEGGFVSTQTNYDPYSNPYLTTPSPIQLQQQADIIRAHNRKLQQLYQSQNYNPYSKYDQSSSTGYLPPAYAYSYSSPQYSHRYPASAYAHRYAAPTNAQSLYQTQVYTTTPPPYRPNYYNTAAQLYRNPHSYDY